jgi:hypothetical protein
MEKINSQPVRTPATIATSIILFTITVCFAMVVTTFHIADFGNFQTGFFWLMSVMTPAAVVGATSVIFYDKEIAREVARSKSLFHKGFSKGFDNGFEEALYQAYTVLENEYEMAYSDFEEFREVFREKEMGW